LLGLRARISPKSLARWMLIVANRNGNCAGSFIVFLEPWH
jgi:hypothetical protein